MKKTNWMKFLRWLLHLIVAVLAGYGGGASGAAIGRTGAHVETPVVAPALEPIGVGYIVAAHA